LPVDHGASAGEDANVAPGPVQRFPARSAGPLLGGEVCHFHPAASVQFSPAANTRCPAAQGGTRPAVTPQRAPSSPPCGSCGRRFRRRGCPALELLWTCPSDHSALTGEARPLL